MPFLLCPFPSKLLRSGLKADVLWGLKPANCKHTFNQEPLWINGWWAAAERSRHRISREGIHGEEEICKDVAFSFVALLKACVKNKDLHEGTRLHTDICKSGLLETNTLLGNMVITMYAKCGALHKAQQVLHQLHNRDNVSWNVLIAGYAQNGQGEQALNFYEQMLNEGLSPDAVTYSCILKACGITQNLDIGARVYDEIVSQGLLRGDIVLGSSLVDMYAKCGMLAKAKEVLDELPARDVVSWNALISGYSQQGNGEEALECFEMMQREGLSPTAITYTCVLKACAITDEVDRGKKIHEDIAGQGLLGKNYVLGTALVDMYAKFGMLSKAETVLAELGVRDVVLWNALITGYAQQGQCKEVLACFKQMQSDGVSPDASTYACTLKVCGIAKEIEEGKQIHNMIIDQGLFENNIVLGTSLVDMYAKCGELKKASQVLGELHARDVISWNALIAGYAQQGQGKEALHCIEQMKNEGFIPNLSSWNAVIGGYAQQGMTEETLDCFQSMQREGIPPDAITFVSVLSACSHSGLIVEGQTFYESMQKVHGILPNIEHHTCMIDLFGRTGHLDKAMAMIKKLPSCHDLLAWSALLGACQNWGNVKLGRWAFEHAINLDKHDPAAYICMEKIYLAAGMLEDAQKIATTRMRNALCIE